ncbi:MAG TPA: DMT family transporter [Candidatus Binataceae bacterium]|nr:DMT family transporter [Candidatus Binataceae bacterium]
MVSGTGPLAAGITQAVITTVTGAMLPIVTRYGATHIDPLLFCAGSALVAAVCALPMLRNGDGFGALIDPRYRLRLAAISLAGSFLPSLAMVYGLRRVNAVSAVLLLQTEPVYSLAIATLVVGEAPSLRQMIATATILLGIVSAFGGGAGIDISAIALLVALTPLMWQVSHAITLRVMPPLRPISVTAARNAFAAILLGGLLALRSPSALRQLEQLNVVATLLTTGAIVYFIGTLTWYGAISRLSLSWTTAVVVPGVPVLSVLFAVVFLGERTGIRQLAAIAVAIAGILALVLGSDPSRPRAAQIEAIEVPAPPGAA